MFPQYRGLGLRPGLMQPSLKERAPAVQAGNNEEVSKDCLWLQLVLSWPGAYGGQSAGACMGGIKWPGLDSIVLLGTSVDPSSITLQVCDLLTLTIVATRGSLSQYCQDQVVSLHECSTQKSLAAHPILASLSRFRTM